MSTAPFTFHNFWCSVSRIKLGPRVPQATLAAIAEVIRRASDTRVPVSK
jgi:hypothetical protein